MPKRVKRYLRQLRDKDVKGIDLLVPAGLAFGAGLGLFIAKAAGLIAVSATVPWLAIAIGAGLLIADALKKPRR